MSWIAIIALIFVIFIMLAVFNARKSPRAGAIGLPYLREELLFSVAERSFLGVLDQALGPNNRVFGKVRVADIAKVKAGLSNSARQGALNRVAAKHFDFVVCRASDLTVLCAVELDDKSHSTKRARARDQLLEQICQTINLPLMRVTAQSGYAI